MTELGLAECVGEAGIQREVAQYLENPTGTENKCQSRGRRHHCWTEDMADTTDSQDLLKRSQAGDLAAFGDLVRQHEGWLRGMLRARLRDWTAADDLAQDAFVTAFRKIKGFRGDSTFETWLTGIAMNHFRNHIRKHREEYIGGNEELQQLLGADEEPRTAGGESLQALQECLQKVTGPSRELLEARYVLGKTVREIEAETGRGYSALTMQLHRLRGGLAECVERTLKVWQT